MRRHFLVGAMALAITASGAGAAVAAKSAAAPKRAEVDAVSKVQYKVNRFVKDSLRWKKDVYHVRSGGTLHIVNKANDGPHTFSVVDKKDLPRTTKQINQCAICRTIGEELGAPPENSDAPPTHLFAEDGVGQDTPPNVDKPGDTAFVAPDLGSSVDLTVTARKGTKLFFMCAIHPWMQAKVIVG